MSIKEKAFGLGNEFKTFIAKGNVMDLAVGVIIGAAFGKIVDSIVKDVIMPTIGMFAKAPDFSSIAIGAHKAIQPDGKEILTGGIMVGNFLNAVVAFLILAAVVFFCLVKPMNKLMASIQKPKAPDVPPPTPEDIQLLREIRDLLKSQDPPAHPAERYGSPTHSVTMEIEESPRLLLLRIFFVLDAVLLLLIGGGSLMLFPRACGTTVSISQPPPGRGLPRSASQGCVMATCSTSSAVRLPPATRRGMSHGCRLASRAARSNARSARSTSGAGSSHGSRPASASSRPAWSRLFIYCYIR